jgi:hypothetical protein
MSGDDRTKTLSTQKQPYTVPVVRVFPALIQNEFAPAARGAFFCASESNHSE